MFLYIALTGQVCYNDFLQSYVHYINSICISE